MKLVRQRHAVDCGTAAIAMLASVSYRQVEAADVNPESTRGYSVPELQGTLKALGVHTTCSRPAAKTLAQGIPIGPAICLIRENGKSWGHWIATNTTQILDPEKWRASSAQADSTSELLRFL